MTGPSHDVELRARTAAFGLRRATDVRPPELADLVRAGTVRRVGRVASLLAVLAVLGAVVAALTSISPPVAVVWITGIVLVALLVATWLLCAHAGGHAWLMPLPALVLAGLWALSLGGRDHSVGWWFVAMSAASAAGGVSIGSTALRQRLRSAPPALPSLEGAPGIAVTVLAPVGIVQVAGESWTAESLSGSLPVGAAVHVVRVEGLRLIVWSEDGTVPDATVLSSEEERP